MNIPTQIKHEELIGGKKYGKLFEKEFEKFIEYGFIGSSIVLALIVCLGLIDTNNWNVETKNETNSFIHTHDIFHSSPDRLLVICDVLLKNAKSYTNITDKTINKGSILDCLVYTDTSIGTKQLDSIPNNISIPISNEYIPYKDREVIILEKGNIIPSIIIEGDKPKQLIHSIWNNYTYTSNSIRNETITTLQTYISNNNNTVNNEIVSIPGILSNGIVRTISEPILSVIEYKSLIKTILMIAMLLTGTYIKNDTSTQYILSQLKKIKSSKFIYTLPILMFQLKYVTSDDELLSILGMKDINVFNIQSNTFQIEYSTLVFNIGLWCSTYGKNTLEFIDTLGEDAFMNAKNGKQIPDTDILEGLMSTIQLIPTFLDYKLRKNILDYNKKCMDALLKYKCIAQNKIQFDALDSFISSTKYKNKTISFPKIYMEQTPFTEYKEYMDIFNTITNNKYETVLIGLHSLLLHNVQHNNIEYCKRLFKYYGTLLQKHIGKDTIESIYYYIQYAILKYVLIFHISYETNNISSSPLHIHYGSKMKNTEYGYDIIESILNQLYNTRNIFMFYTYYADTMYWNKLAIDTVKKIFSNESNGDINGVRRNIYNRYNIDTIKMELNDYSIRYTYILEEDSNNTLKFRIIGNNSFAFEWSENGMNNIEYELYQEIESIQRNATMYSKSILNFIDFLKDINRIKYDTSITTTNEINTYTSDASNLQNFVINTSDFKIVAENVKQGMEKSILLLE